MRHLIPLGFALMIGAGIAYSEGWLILDDATRITAVGLAAAGIGTPFQLARGFRR